MLKINDFVCPNCEHQQEELTEESNLPTCPECNIPMNKIISTPCLLSDQEKRHKMLQQRSKEHTLRCKRKGIPLDANESGIASDPVWKNKYRPRNTRTDTISQHANDHVHWREKNEQLKKQFEK